MKCFKSTLFAIALTVASAATSETKSAERDMTAHFHHVRLNVTDIEATSKFYEKFFGATRTSYRGNATSLFTERSFLLLNLVKDPPQTNDGTSLWHIGWSGVDGPSEFKWRTDDGIHVHTPLTKPVLPGIDNKAEVMYFWGPDKEIVEVSTVNRNHRFEHVHLLVSDINAATDWFKTHLGLAPQHERAILFYGVMLNVISVDNVDIVLFARPTPDRYNQFAARKLWPSDGFKPTEGRVINHIAFSYAKAQPALDRMTADGVTIVEGLRKDPRQGHKSFLVRGPDNLLIEIVESKPLPEGVWSE